MTATADKSNLEVLMGAVLLVFAALSFALSMLLDHFLASPFITAIVLSGCMVFGITGLFALAAGSAKHAGQRMSR